MSSTPLKLVKSEAPNNTIGVIASISDDGQVLVTCDLNQQPTPALSTQFFAEPQSLVGEQVLLAFVDNDLLQPVIVGLLSQSVSNELLIHNSTKHQKKLHISVEDFALNATKNIDINVGHSSLLLDRFGKIVLKGKNLISRATGKNKIKGGSISLN